MPTMGRFGRDEIAEQLYRDLLRRFAIAIENEGGEMTSDLEQKIIMFFCNEVSPEWIQRNIVRTGVEHKVSRAMTLGVLREWRGSPDNAKLFRAYGDKDFWNIR